MASGEYRKEELLEAARNGNEDLLMSLLTPLNVNCHASDGRKVLLLSERTAKCKEPCSKYERFQVCTDTSFATRIWLTLHARLMYQQHVLRKLCASKTGWTLSTVPKS